MKNSHIIEKFYKKLGAERLEKLANEWKVNDDIKFVRKLLRKDDRILDIGSGYGRVAIPIAKAGFDITGIDISDNLIREARRRAKEVGISAKFDVGNMTKLPYKDESFTKIISTWNAFNELLTKKEQSKTLDEVFRVLRPGGTAFVVVRDGEQKEIRKELQEKGAGPDRRLLKDELEGVESVTYMHDRSTLRHLCERSKFKKWKIQFKNMNARRRLVMYLYK